MSACTSLSYSNERSLRTRDIFIDKRPPESEAVVEGAALVLFSKRLKANGGIDAAGARRHVAGDKVVKSDADPLGRRRAARIGGGLAHLGHVVGARRNGRRKVGCVGAPVVDQDVLQEGHLGTWVVEHGIGSA